MSFEFVSLSVGVIHWGWEAWLVVYWEACIPSKNELARSCKNLARILHARLAWHVHAICVVPIDLKFCTFTASLAVTFSMEECLSMGGGNFNCNL